MKQKDENNETLEKHPRDDRCHALHRLLQQRRCVYEAAELSGMWQKVYDEGIADAGIAQYTFHPQSANNGTVEIFTSDWASGDTTVYRIYTVTDAGHLHISPKPDDTSVALTVDCDIRRLTSTQMIWYNTDSNEELARFKKIK